MSLDLYQLISSLSKGEKRKISIELSGGHQKSSGSQQLFNLIAIKGVYDTVLLRSLLPNIKNLPATKNKLLEKIITILAQDQDSFNAEYYSTMQKVEFLISKKLYPLALKKVQHLYDRAKKFDKVQFLFDIYLKEIDVLKKMENHTSSTIVLDQKYKEVMVCHEEMANILMLHKNYHEANNFLQINGPSRSEEESKEYVFFESKILKSPTNKGLNNPTEYFRFLGLIAVYFGLNNMDKALVYSNRLVELFETNSIEKKTDLIQYVSILYSNLAILVSQRNYSEFDLKIKRLIALDPIQKSDFRIIKERYFSLVMFRCFVAKDFEKSTSILREFEIYYNNTDNVIGELYEPMILGLSTTLCLYFGDYKKALYWNNKLLALTYQKKIRSDLIEAAGLFELIIHYQLNNFKLLDSKIDALKYKLKKAKTLTMIPGVLIKRFKKIVNSNSPEHVEILKELILEIEKIKKGKQETNFLDKFDLIFFLKAKVKELES